jgi:hypothetical protein
MPHVDGMSLSPGFRQSGESWFAGPVAAITSVVVASFEHARTALARWQARRSEQALLRSYARKSSRKSWEIRKRDEDYARATDLPDLERMEREWDRRDGGGIRTWDWR